MLEIPELLLFVCVWMLFVFGAAENKPTLQRLACGVYLISAAAAAMMLLDNSLQVIAAICVSMAIIAVWDDVLRWATTRGKQLATEAKQRLRAPDSIQEGD